MQIKTIARDHYTARGNTEPNAGEEGKKPDLKTKHTAASVAQ